MRRYLLDGVRRLAAPLCLGASYELAITDFDVRWLGVATICAAVVATGESFWAESSYAEPRLAWPNVRRLGFAFVPGWLGMIAAAVCKAEGAAPGIVIWIWLAGCGWLLIGTWITSRVAGAVAPAPAGMTRWLWLCGALVIAFAAGLRLWRIDSVPHYVHCDEGTIVMTARAFYANPARDWFAPPPNAGAYSIMQLHFALAGWGVLLFGFNLVGARLSDVVLGILSIGLMFDGLRRVSPLRLAVVGSVLLAANHCHLAFSRIASGYIQTAFVVALAFNLLSRVWTAPSYFNAALLGVVMALAVQTYPPSLVSLPLLCLVLAALLTTRAHRARLMAPLVIFGLSCASAAAPFGVAVWQHAGELLGRSHEISILSPPVIGGLKSGVYHTDSTLEVVAQQAWLAVRGFHVGRDHQPQYDIHLPMADRYTAALMLPGAVFVLLGLRQFLAVNTLVFTLGYLWFGLGMEWAPGFNRSTGALPLGMVVPAIALVQCADTLCAGRAWVLRRARDLIIAAAVALCVYAGVHIYFLEYGRSLEWGDSPSEAGWAARRYARDYTIHLVDWPLPGNEGLQLILGDLPVALHYQHDTVAYVQTAPVTHADLFILDRNDVAAHDALLARFPAARVEEWRPHATAGASLWLMFVGGAAS